MSENTQDKTLLMMRTKSLKEAGFRARGGLSEIHTAFDSSGEMVIQRQLRKDLRFNLSLRRRFLHGIKVRRKMGHHPHIVHYISQRGGLQPLEIIEYVPGDNLKMLIANRHRLVKEQPFDLLRQVAEGLAQVHRKGFLHLDVKPENVLVSFKGEAGVVKVTDFDFAQPITTAKVSRKFGGSLAYEPPEFLAHKQVSIGTDIFAFGVLAYQLFTYQMPFVESSADLRRTPDNEVQFSSGQADRTTPPVQLFLRRCLAMRPEYRYGSDKALMTGLLKAQREHVAFLASAATANS